MEGKEIVSNDIEISNLNTDIKNIEQDIECINNLLNSLPNDLYQKQEMLKILYNRREYLIKTKP